MYCRQAGMFSLNKIVQVPYELNLSSCAGNGYRTPEGTGFTKENFSQLQQLQPPRPPRFYFKSPCQTSADSLVGHARSLLTWRVSALHTQRSVQRSTNMETLAEPAPGFAQENSIRSPRPPRTSRCPCTSTSPCTILLLLLLVDLDTLLLSPARGGGGSGPSVDGSSPSRACRVCPAHCPLQLTPSRAMESY